DAMISRSLMRADDPGDAITIGDRDRLETERGSLLHQLIRMRPAAQERKIAGRLQFGVTTCGIEEAAVVAGCLPHRAGQPQIVAADRAGQSDEPGDGSG